MVNLREQRAYLSEEYDLDDPDEPSELELVYRALADEQAEVMTLQAELVQCKREIARLQEQDKTEITRLTELNHLMAYRERDKDNVIELKNHVIEQLRDLLGRLANIKA